MAFSHPHLEVAGIDVSRAVIDYANAKARSQGLRNASFGVMGILDELDFSDNTFDLIHGSFLSVRVPRESWNSVLKECWRILRPGGVLRLIDTDGVVTNSSICESFNELVCRAFHTAGYGFSPDGRSLGITPVIETLFQKAGFQHTHCTPYQINFSADTPSWMEVYRSLEVIGRLLQTVLTQEGAVADADMEQAYKRGIIELLAADFCGIWPFVSVYGVKPE
ncbi:hypothetical protein KDK_17020 [Dictyobacter kobayashii]|uniref:Methyltransferase domain-containing protein n=1 Tax=Dictyobacter kobayashii TaxID=2014872 RepID=A0A402AFP2_9CHLR|nr:hypothetical protein KDK_17020 [Dictyobacter kobayashii]